MTATTTDVDTPRIKYAEIADVKKVVRKMPEGHIHCRTLGHVWVHRTVHRVPGGFEQTLGCKNCDTQKLEYISRTGAKLNTRTTYGEDGYLLKGLGRVVGDAKNVFRLASLNAALKSQGSTEDLLD